MAGALLLASVLFVLCVGSTQALNEKVTGQSGESPLLIYWKLLGQLQWGKHCLNSREH